MRDLREKTYEDTLETSQKRVVITREERQEKADQEFWSVKSDSRRRSFGGRRQESRKKGRSTGEPVLTSVMVQLCERTSSVYQNEPNEVLKEILQQEF